MSLFVFKTTPDNDAAAADLPRAIYFVLEAHDNRILMPLCDAITYSLHIGLSDRPDHCYAWDFGELEHALMALEYLTKKYPGAGLWLRTELIETEMLGDTVWEGIVNAQAEIDELDEHCHWVRVSRLMARADTYQESLWRHLKDWAQGLDGEPDVPMEILCRL